MRSSLGRGRRGPLRVLELGSGCGLLGIGLAATCEDVEVVVTDPALGVNFTDLESGSTLDWLRANVELNRDAVGSRCSAAKLEWGNDEDIEKLLDTYTPFGGFDLLVGSDLLYDPDRYAALHATISAFGARTILGYPTRHGSEKRFFNSAEPGWVVGPTWPLPATSTGGLAVTCLEPRSTHTWDENGDIHGHA